MNRNLRFGAALAAAALSSSSFAFVAFSNFGPGDSFNVGDGWTIAGPSSVVSTQVVASQFTALYGGRISNMRIVMGNAGGVNVGEFALYSDSGSDTIGTMMVKIWGGLPDFGSGQIIDVELNIDSLVLTAGAKYWVRGHYHDDGAWDAWNLNDIGDVRRTGFSTDGGLTYEYRDDVSGVFEVNVVPEPATMAALGIGALGLLRRRRK